MGVGANAQTYNNKSLPARGSVYAEFAGASMLVGINLTHVLQTENVDNIFMSERNRFLLIGTFNAKKTRKVIEC